MSVYKVCIPHRESSPCDADTIFAFVPSTGLLRHPRLPAAGDFGTSRARIHRASPRGTQGSSVQFASVVYLAFLAISVAVYHALPGVRSRTAWLLVTSLVFYYSISAAWTLALLAVTAIGYVAALAMRPPDADSGEPASRTRWARGIGIALVLGILFFFKYTAFAGSMLLGGLEMAGIGASFPVLQIALPVGVSFWTFSTIAYLVDVSKGTLPAERNLARYAVFVGFFPHVTAGPIARGSQLLPQLATKHRFDYDGMRSALVLMAWGFFKKLLIADPLGVIVANVYKNPQAYSARENGLILALATVAFAIQIYADFSGYTDIVRGSARLFGVDLMRNFNRPYFATSVKEFWRRWHMTLMGWLKDYVYIPLGGSRVGQARRYANILTVFLVSGIWHGAGLTFIIWGLLNGVYQIVGDLTQKARDGVAAAFRLKPGGTLRTFVQIVITFTLITVAWVFFRAQSLADALYIVPRMFVPTLQRAALAHLGLNKYQALAALIATVVMFALDYLSLRTDLFGGLYRQHVAVRWLAYAAMIFVIVVFGHYGPAYSASAFAYFKF
jgi:alginate O-acetyltransferase complex protein AlgI